MSMNVKSGLVLGLLLSIGVYAEELQKPEETAEANEVTDLIFDMWYEGKNSLGVRRLVDEGYIRETEDQYDMYLETAVRYEDVSDFFSEERESFSAFILRKNIEAERLGKMGRYASFLDSRTRCVNLVNGNKAVVYVKCRTRFTKQEFAERLKKKQMEQIR